VEKKMLSPEEKERTAFRAELLTFICSVGDLIDSINDIMHMTPEERDEFLRKKDVFNEFGVRIDENKPYFVNYLREARKLPDDEDLFFEGLLTLSKKVAKLP